MASFDGGDTVSNNIRNLTDGVALGPVQNGAGEVPSDYAVTISPQPVQEISDDATNSIYRR